VLACALRPDVTAVTLVDPPTRGIYTITPRRDPHPRAAHLLDQLTTAFASGPAQAAHRPTGADAHAAASALHDGITDA
jgi:hypothetical protein